MKLKSQLKRRQKRALIRILNIHILYHMKKRISLLSWQTALTSILQLLCNVQLTAQKNRATCSSLFHHIL